MKNYLIAAVFLLAPAASMADSHDTAIVEMWQCELKEGAKMEQVEANNVKWLAHARAVTGSNEVNSYSLTSVVGDLTTFVFVDAYPTMAAWSVAKSAEKSEEGAAIEAAFQELIDCTKNRLYKSRQY